MEQNQDTIYRVPKEELGPFCFNQEVARVFRNMIERSVPGYNTILSTLESFSQRFYQPDTSIYDLGCSLCDSSLAIAKALRDRPHKIIAVDNSKPMLDEARKRLSAFTFAQKIKLLQADITQLEFSPYSFAVLNFTLQFIAPEKRNDFLSRLRQACVPHGALCISEKIKADDHGNNALLVDLHHEWKKQNGYSDLEVSQKRTALENVLIPDSFHVLIDRFKDAGFSKITPWFQHFNFVSILVEP